MMKEKYFKQRNIINHDEIEVFLISMAKKCPNAEEYVWKNVKNFCYQSSPIKIAKIEDIKKYQIVNKNTQMHLVILDYYTVNNYFSALLYFIDNGLDYKNKSFYDVYSEFNQINSFKLFADVVLNPGQTNLIKVFSDGCELLELIDQQAYLHEGDQMGNCVYSYFDTNSTIYSYRKNNKSIMTLEFIYNRLNACKLRFNQEVNFRDYPELFTFIESTDLTKMNQKNINIDFDNHLTQFLIMLGALACFFLILFIALNVARYF